MAPSLREYPSLRAHLIGMLGLFAALFLALAVFLYSASRSLFTDALRLELSGDLEWMASTLRDHPDVDADPARLDSLCKTIAGFKGFRVTVIAADGRVRADSHVPRDSVSGLENHASRPEVIEARDRGLGQAWRYSSTLGRGMLYVALRLPHQAGYLRMAAGPVVLNRFQVAAATAFALFLGLFLAASAAVTWWISRKISTPLLHLTESADGAEADPSRPGAPTPRWEARFREAEVLNDAFTAYVDRIRALGGEVSRERDKLAAVLNQLDEGIVILSAAGTVVAANPSSLRLLGAPGPSSAWLGRTLAEAVPNGPLARWVAEAASPDRPPVIHIDKGPEAPFDLVCHLAPLSSGGGGAGEYLLTLLNVSEFRHLDRVKSEFVANASHELKTPLSSLKGYAEALIEGALEDPKVRLPFVKKIQGSALRLERLVQDLLSLSRLESDAPPREPEPLPLRAYVTAAAGHHREAIDAAGLRFENHVADEVKVPMEARDLELILDNLIGNAVRYNKPGGKIKVWTDAEADGIRLSVKDTGIGIAEDMLPRIFERFYRAGASRATKDGTGLGLAIVKHAAAKYGMPVAAESILGEGSRFVVVFPSP